MPILTMPTNKNFERASFALRSATQVFASPLTNAVQTQLNVGSVWVLEGQLPPINLADAVPWLAFLTALDGRTGRFYASDPLATYLKDPGLSGTPSVTGGSQTGTSLSITGVSGTMRAGSYFSFDTPGGGRELKMVTEDRVGSGTVNFRPAIRVSPLSGAAINVTNPTGIFRLDDDVSSWEMRSPDIYDIVLRAVEAYPV